VRGGLDWDEETVKRFKSMPDRADQAGELPVRLARRRRGLTQRAIAHRSQHPVVSHKEVCPMPFVRIDLVAGKSAEYRRTIGEVVYDAMIQTLKVPEDDRFQVIAEHSAENLVIDPSYLGIARSGDCIMIQVTLNEGRTIEMKRAFYAAVANGLHQRLGLRREDVFINLVEVRKEDWSFGNGEAQYAQ
jgi:4-oxalocrotonate tautomerase